MKRIAKTRVEDTMTTRPAGERFNPEAISSNKGVRQPKTMELRPRSDHPAAYLNDSCRRRPKAPAVNRQMTPATTARIVWVPAGDMCVIYF
jgi:hypothetical protein